MLWAGAWLTFYVGLRPIWPASGRWLILSGVVLAYNLFIVWRNLPANHRQDETALLPTLGPGNALTLVRGLCIGLLAGFLFGPWPPGTLAWIIVLLYTFTDIADYFDGFLARRTQHVTQLGGVLDMEFDGQGTLVVVLLAVSFGQLPWWYMGLGLARYLFVFGLWLRRRLALPIHDITPSIHRRVFAGLQMGFLSVVLWPILPRPMAVIAGTLFALATSLSFVRDWFVASGQLDPIGYRYQRVQRALYRTFAVVLPLLWRPLLFITMISIFSAAAPMLIPTAWRILLSEWGVPAPSFFAFLIALVGFIGAPLVGLGILPRVLAVALTLPIGFDMITRGLMADNTLALVSVVMIQLFGSGPFALWPAEERFMFQRLGER